MFEKAEDLRNIVNTVSELLKAEGEDELFYLLDSAEISMENTGYDNWDGGIYFFTIYLNIDVANFVKVRDRIEKIEADLLARFEVATRGETTEQISNIRITPKAQSKIDWSKISGLITQDNLIKEIEFLKNTMISVATGGQRIQEINNEYQKKFKVVDTALSRLNFQNPNPYKDLWEWYGKWSSDFPTYRERRAYIREIYSTLLESLNETQEPESISITVDLSGWERIERSILEIKTRQNEATNEEQFQVVGLLCRETVITLAQSVFIADKHPILDGVEVSATDAKRMLEAYIAVELGGASNKKLRQFARSTLDLANELTHKRTASKKDASLCSIATLSLINFIGTIEGRI